MSDIGPLWRKTSTYIARQAQVEKVAQALWEAQYTKNYDEPHTAAMDYRDNPRWKTEFENLAKAAIEAHLAWRDMCDALLGGGGDPLSEMEREG